MPPLTPLLALCASQVKALAHITGGGLLENLPRVLPSGIKARMDGKAWQPPPVFGWLAGGSRCGVSEMLRTFNCGLGMVLVVAKEDAEAVTAALVKAGEPQACAVGVLETWDGGGEQVQVEGTEAWGWSC